MRYGKSTPNYTNVKFFGRADLSFSFGRSDSLDDTDGDYPEGQWASSAAHWNRVRA
jgi:hypothetical protein